MSEIEKQACMNCGAQVTGAYCSSCGQKTDISHRTVKQLASEFWEEYGVVDNKLLRSFASLFSRPGALTTNYIQGKRKQFILPFRLFLVSIILFIFSFTIMVPIINNLIGIESANFDIISVGVGDKTDTLSPEELVAETTEAEEMSRNLFANMMLTIQAVMIFMVPVFALFTKLAYIRWKEFFYVDHLIFALHFHALMFTTFAIVTLFSYYDFIMSIAVVVAMVYLYLAQRRVFSKGVFSTVMKTLIMLSVYLLLAFVVVTLVALFKTIGAEMFFRGLS